MDLVYHSQQIYLCEALAARLLGISSRMMMERAGEAAYRFLRQRWPTAQKIAVFCGNGNNGGDGYLLAQQAHDQGLTVTVWQVGDPGKLKATVADTVCKERAIVINPCQADSALSDPEVIVDAVYGIGLKNHLRPEGLIAIQKMQEAACPILSLDVPSGIHADTGEKMGAAVRATATITFIGLKLGLLTGEGIAHTGELVCDHLDLPQELLTKLTPLLARHRFDPHHTDLPPRPRHWHKGLSGRVLIVGGDSGFSGAPLLAAEAALRVGAGAVSIATSPGHATVLNLRCPEIMCHGINDVRQLIPLLAKVKSLVIGPGLGQSRWSKKIGHYLLAACVERIPAVSVLLDADALNLLANTTGYSPHWILTPHPGEAARLLGTTVASIEADRLLAATHLSKQYGGVCVLKGAGSLIVTQEGLPVVCDAGNPGMASAGMGDLLSGVIGGLLAQGLAPVKAAQLGVCLHAMAGDQAAIAGERGMIASDLLPYVRRLVNGLPYFIKTW